MNIINPNKLNEEIKLLELEERNKTELITKIVDNKKLKELSTYNLNYVKTLNNSRTLIKNKIETLKIIENCFTS